MDLAAQNKHRRLPALAEAQREEGTMQTAAEELTFLLRILMLQVMVDLELPKPKICHLHRALVFVGVLEGEELLGLTLLLVIVCVEAKGARVEQVGQLTGEEVIPLLQQLPWASWCQT